MKFVETVLNILDGENFPIMSYLRLAILLLMNFNILIVGDKINERRILLPYNSGVPTNFTLVTFGDTSCYRWSSSRPDIASVKHLDSKHLNDDGQVLSSTSSSSSSSTPTSSSSSSSSSCSKVAMVTVVSTIPKRQSTVITAHDIKSNQQIRCDVEIDVIDRIVIETVTKEIVLGEQPEKIIATAYSDKNDIFTSIGGIPFDWSLIPSDVLRYRQWSSSTYAAPDFVEYWESRGQKSSYILVEGIKTGSAQIQTKILSDAYGSIESDTINIHVVANLLLIPSNDVYLVPGATVLFRAEISKQGPRVPLTFPNPQYYLEVDDPDVAVFNEETSLLEALREGQTTLILKDRNMVSTSPQTNLLFSRTRTDIHVKQPAYISMSIKPGDKFQLCNDLIYNFELSLHDDAHNRLYPSDNLLFDLKFDENFIEMLHVSLNKTFYVVRTRQIGSTKLIAEFHGAGSYLLADALVHQQDVTIYPPIKLMPEEIHLPYLPQQPPITYTVHVEATGATGGGYNWQSANDSLAIVKYSAQRSAQATILAKSVQGEVIITCTDVHDSLIFNANMKIHILPVDALEILPSIVEAEIGGQVHLPIAVMAILKDQKEKKYYFDDCSRMKFHVDIVEKNRIRFDPDSILPGLGRKSCRSLSFECMASGNSRIRISYPTNGDENISTQAIIGCYKPLRLVHPNELAVLSLGAAIDLAFEGGPRPWSMYPEGHYKRAMPNNASVVEIKEIRDRYRYNKDLHVFRASCFKYGNVELVLKVGNQPSPTLQNPAFAETTVKIKCSPPETLILKPRTKPSCPQQDGQYTLEKNKKIELDVQVLDPQGQLFYNCSTFYFEWSKDTMMGMFEEINGVRQEVNGANGYQILKRTYQVLAGLNANKTRIRCRITGYHQYRLFADQFDVSREIELITTDPLVISKARQENSITILKHADFQRTLSIEQGSGYFSIDWTPKQNIQVELAKQDKRRLIIAPLNIGNGMITIGDLCLDYPPVAVAYSVVEPIDIKVDLVDKIQLGDRVDGTFSVLDNRGNKLPSSMHPYMDFTVTSSNNYLSVGDIQPKDEHHSRFTIKAERLGLCKLLIQSQSSKIRPLQSARIDVQIFSPLKIWPSNITLIVGNCFQPQFVDGPQIQRNIEFSIDDETIAKSINPDGLLQALKIGHTKITARVTNVNNHEYSRAQAHVNVVPLKKIKIWAPIHQVLVGNTIPMYLIGGSEQHETPFMFGHAEPPLKITWSLSNDKIGTLESSFQKFGITDKLTDQISASFVAKSIGLVTVRVQLEISTDHVQPPSNALLEQIHGNQILTDSIQLQVNPDFLLTISSTNDLAEHHFRQFPMRALLMSPQSELVLHQNQLDAIDYRVWNASSQIRLLNQTGSLVLQAGDLLESSALMIQRDLHRTGIHQYYSQAIHVEKVRYLSLEFDLMKHPPEQLATMNLDSFPIGSDISMVIQYHDQLGRTFDSVKSNIKWMLSRNDIVNMIDSFDSPQSSLQIRALKPGSVILNIWDEVNQLRQYYKIIVGRAIVEETAADQHQPLSVLVSDVVCLRTKMDENHRAHGRWYLEQDQPLLAIGWIHPQHGVFVGLNPGHGRIVYNHSTTISTYKHVQVKPLTKISLDIDSNLAGLSTIHWIYVPIVVDGQTNHSQSSGCSTDPHLDDLVNGQQPSPFTCDASISEMEMIETLWNVEVQYRNHHWNCLLMPRANLELDSIAFWNHNVTLTVMVTASLAEPFNEDSLYNSLRLFHQVQLPLLPAFRMTTSQIILTPDSKESRFSVYSVPAVLDELLVKSSNEDIIGVQKLSAKDEENDAADDDYEGDEGDLVVRRNTLRIVVTLKNADIFSTDVSNLHLLLHSRLINQTEKIPVQIKLYGGILFGDFPATARNLFSTPGYSTAHFVLYNFLMIIFTLMLGFLIYFLMKRFIINGQQHIVYIKDGLSPKSPRIIDYNQTTPNTDTPNSRSALFGPTAMNYSPNMMTPLRANVGTRMTSSSLNDATSGSHASGSPAASPSSSPKIGRPLYSTRSCFN